MKQVTIRMPEYMHQFLLDEIEKNNGYPSLQQHIIKKIFSDRFIYRTNHEGKIQLRINQTYLGNMLVLGRMETFNAIYAMMKDALNEEEQVIIESHANNDVPFEKITFKNCLELDNWYGQITNIRA